MKNDYDYTKTTISFVQYHFVFCPRYRRKIFTIAGLEQRFKELTFQECKKYGIRVLSLECYADYVYMLVRVLPIMPIPDIVRKVKGATSVQLRQEFSQLSAMPSLWTRNYFVSTKEEISSEDIRSYVHTQKTRP